MPKLCISTRIYFYMTKCIHNLRVPNNPGINTSQIWARGLEKGKNPSELKEPESYKILVNEDACSKPQSIFYLTCLWALGKVLANTDIWSLTKDFALLWKIGRAHV